ncbi:hypothetical protein H696_02566 [Fonticula alba]|nr:hypothetical protein H696_02566 [Fonticula alba]KCV70236.1 hypothetical protein H696_02566 [Fonticula alba]|eukprot:XP_009494752.1 hypothetical protein H696_02566 [Fonticula alba]
MATTSPFPATEPELVKLPLLAIEKRFINDCIRAICHSIFLARHLDQVRPKDFHATDPDAAGLDVVWAGPDIFGSSEGPAADSSSKSIQHFFNTLSESFIKEIPQRLSQVQVTSQPQPTSSDDIYIDIYDVTSVPADALGQSPDRAAGPPPGRHLERWVLPIQLLTDSSRGPVELFNIEAPRPGGGALPPPDNSPGAVDARLKLENILARIGAHTLATSNWWADTGSVRVALVV